MIRVRTIGFVLLAAGFVGSAFLSVRHADSAGLAWQTVEWNYYAVTFLIGVTGVLILRVTARSADTQSHKVEADMHSVDSSLNSLIDKLRAMVGATDRIPVYDVHGQIDEQLVGDLATFVDARGALTHRYGLQKYADLMSRFAAGERYINRAWSASADGYVDEVWICLARAEKQMAEAFALLSSYKASQDDR